MEGVNHPKRRLSFGSAVRTSRDRPPDRGRGLAGRDLSPERLLLIGMAAGKTAVKSGIASSNMPCKMVRYDRTIQQSPFVRQHGKMHWIFSRP